ncbi:MAG: hypothetical protein GEV06_20065 [Luteitalea sp.]|nr:hypothetical protein [Luteitalea sp.]
MKTMTVAMLVLVASGATVRNVAAQEARSAERQMAAAVLAAPEDRRGDAAVLGYDDRGAVVTLREGSNDLVCLADDPESDEFSVACYHKDLEPFMARGRELRAEGVERELLGPTRWKEVEAGTLPMPREPRTLYALTGKGYDAASGEVTDSYLRWVIYVPFATAESTGLATTPNAYAPWLMDAGTAGAHIMINPPRQKE